MAIRKSQSGTMADKLLVTGTARKHTPPGIVYGVGTFEAEGCNVKRIYLEDDASTILDWVEVPGEEKPLCRYKTPDVNEKVPPKEGFKRYDKSDAFGGLHKYIYGDHFETIREVPHLIAVDEVEGLEGKIVEQDGLFDIEGNLFNNKRYDSIKRYKTDIIDDDAFLVKEGNKYGILLGDGSLFGRDMHEVNKEDISLKKFAGNVYLHIEKDGKEKYITQDGKDAYGGWAEEIKECKIGENVFGLATTGEKICAFSEDNNELYGGLCKKLEEYKVGETSLGLVTYEDDNVELKEMNCETRYGGKHLSLGKQIPHEQLEVLLECYDAEGLIIMDSEGNNHYGEHHKDDSRRGATLFKSGIDLEILLRFLEEEEQENLIKYWREDNRLAYGGGHEEELFAGEKRIEKGDKGEIDEISVMKPGQERIKDVSDLAVEGGIEEEFALNTEIGFVGAKKFRNGRREEDDKIIAPGKICYTVLSGSPLFGGSYIRQTDCFHFKGEVFMGFEKEGKGYIYTDSTGRASQKDQVS